MGQGESGGRSLRRLLMVAVGVPLVIFFGLLGWALAQRGGRPAGVVIYTTLGEVPIEPRPAREFTLTLLDGTTLRLSDLRGRVVVVDFFASWCPPCRLEAPHLARLARRLKPEGVEFVGIAIWDSEGEVRRYIKEFGLPFPVGIDSKGVIGIDYGITGIPEKYIIDPDGILRHKLVGPTTEERLEAVIRGLMPGEGE